MKKNSIDILTKSGVLIKFAGDKSVYLCEDSFNDIHSHTIKSNPLLKNVDLNYEFQHKLINSISEKYQLHLKKLIKYNLEKYLGNGFEFTTDEELISFLIKKCKVKTIGKQNTLYCDNMPITHWFETVETIMDLENENGPKISMIFGIEPGNNYKMSDEV